MIGRQTRSAYLFLLFPLGVLFVFTLVPTILGLGLGFFAWDGGPEPRWVGLKNFTDLASDVKFLPALRNTIVYVIGSVPPMVLIGFLLATAVHAHWFRGRVHVRTLYFLPTILSVVAIGYVWRWLLEPEAGLLNWGLTLLGFRFEHPPDWINNPDTALHSIIAVTVWRGIGFCMVIYLASLATINKSLYEAAEVDGATSWQVLLHITWPQVGPTTVFLFITNVIWSLQVFDIVFVMTGQAENDATNVLNLYIYRLFTYGQLGYAAAVGVVIFVITLVATGLQLAWTMRGRRSSRVVKGAAA